MTKQDLFWLGTQLLNAWCEANKIEPPTISTHWLGKCDFGVCAYYRDGVIDIWPNQCAAIGTAGRQWSYPGYCVDRTPFGVLQHELGHYVDRQHGAAGGTLSHLWHAVDPRSLTSYCPNNNEWFAEWFRLFVTNPHLVYVLRPALFALFDKQWRSVETRPWFRILESAPRQLQAASKRIQRET